MFLFYILFLFCKCATSDTQCPYINGSSYVAVTANSVRIMQFNAEWLFVDYYEPFGCPGDSCPWKNESQAMTHLETVANIIQSVGPDIVNICEVEGCDELNMLLDVFGDDNQYSPYLIQGSDTATGQNVGLLSRIRPTADLRRVETRVNYPIPGSNCGYTGSPGSSAVTKHYITEYQFPVYNSDSDSDLYIAFIGAHLIAYPDDPSRCVQREAQAQVLQQIIAGYIVCGYEIILLGDFNDFDSEVPDKNGNNPISQVLRILKGHIGLYAGTYNLTSIATRLGQDARYTDWYDENNNGKATSNEYSEIDFILVSPKIYARITNVEFVHTYDKSADYFAPDHFPLFMDISLE